MPGMTYDADLVGGAGGEIGILGDYLVFDHRDPEGDGTICDGNF